MIKLHIPFSDLYLEKQFNCWFAAHTGTRLTHCILQYCTYMGTQKIQDYHGEQVNGNRSQVGGLAECNGECSRLIPSLQLPPIMNHTIRICRWATSLVFAHSGDRHGQMASRDSPKPPQQPAENQVTLPERKCCHLSQSSLPLMLYPNASMWTNTCLWIILPCTSTLCIFVSLSEW